MTLVIDERLKREVEKNRRERSDQIALGWLIEAILMAWRDFYRTGDTLLIGTSICEEYRSYRSQRMKDESRRQQWRLGTSLLHRKNLPLLWIHEGKG